MGTDDNRRASLLAWPAMWRCPYASTIALVIVTSAWPAAGYGALVISVAGDFRTTGTQWIFGWPFVAALLVATTLHLLAMGAGARLGIPPLFRDLVALDAFVGRRDGEAADRDALRAALRAVTRFPVMSLAVGVVLALLVVATCIGMERLAAGARSPNVWVILRGGLYATAFYGSACLPLGELLTRPACRALRSEAVRTGIDPYDGFALAGGWRIVVNVVPTVTALLVAAEVVRGGGGPVVYSALIALTTVVVFILNWLQYENGRSAVRELSQACRDLAEGREAALVTGSIEPLLLEMAALFNTAARRVGADRRSSGERYRAVFEAALDCIITADREGRIVEFNPAAEQAFGYTRAEVLGRPLVDTIIPPALAGAHRAGFERYLTTGRARVLGRRMELAARRADGTEFPAEIALAEIGGGGPPMFMAHVRDITERKRAEEALAASTRRIEEEVEITAALLRVTQTANAELGRPDLLEQIARFAVEALDCDWGSIYVWDERRQAFRLLANAGARAEIRAEVEQIEFTASGFAIVRAAEPGRVLELPDAANQKLVPSALLERWGITSMLAAPIARGDEVVGSLIAGYRTRKGPFAAKQRRVALGIAHAAGMALANSRLIADLEAASRLKSEFVSTMSHELRSPLNVILGYAEMSRDPAVSPAEQREHLCRIEAAGRDLLTLIESTLEVGKLEAGRTDVRLEEVQLPAFWSDVRRGCAALPCRPDVALEWGDAPAIALQTDPRKLTIVIRNLVGNALKFTEHGSVRVDVRLGGDALVLRVADTGIGIRPEDQTAIFEMFRQADGSDSRRYGGTGLGLYIVRRFVEQLGGYVEVASGAGRGSTFTVTLPAAGTARPVRDATWVGAVRGFGQCTS